VNRHFETEEDDKSNSTNSGERADKGTAVMKLMLGLKLRLRICRRKGRGASEPLESGKILKNLSFSTSTVEHD